MLSRMTAGALQKIFNCINSRKLRISRITVFVVAKTREDTASMERNTSSPANIDKKTCVLKYFDETVYLQVERTDE